MEDGLDRFKRKIESSSNETLRVVGRGTLIKSPREIRDDNKVKALFKRIKSFGCVRKVMPFS